MERVSALRECLPYLRAFHGSLFVVKLGGEVCAGNYLDNIAEQISLLCHVGIKVIVVHGGGPQMNALLAQLGIQRRMINGRRITDDATLHAAKLVYAGELNTNVVAALSRWGTRAVGLTGADCRLLHAERRPPVDMKDESGRTVTVDFGHVGDIVSVNNKIVGTLVDDNAVPVICSLGIDAEGNVLNVNADTIASRVAQSVKAKKLVLMSNVPGILQDPKNPASLISYADTETLEGLVADGTISGGMLPKVQACLEAVRNGVARTHVIDGTRPDSLLTEIFINEGCGTMIVDRHERQEYEQHEKAAGNQ